MIQGATCGMVINRQTCNLSLCTPPLIMLEASRALWCQPQHYVSKAGGERPSGSVRSGGLTPEFFPSLQFINGKLLLSDTNLTLMRITRQQGSTKSPACTKW